MIQGIDAIHASLEEFLSRRRSNNVELALSAKEEIEKIIKNARVEVGEITNFYEL